MFKEQGLKRKAKLLTPPHAIPLQEPVMILPSFSMHKQEEDLRRNHLPRSSPRARGLTRSGGDLAPPAGHAETELVVPLFHGAVGAQAWVACSHSPRCLETLGDPPPRGASPARSSNPLPQLPPAPDVPVPLSSWEFATPVFLLARCPWLSDRLEWWKGHWLWT